VDRIAKQTKLAMIKRHMNEGKTMKETADALGTHQSFISSFLERNGVKWERHARHNTRCVRRGSMNGNAKLSERDVKAIRRAQGERYAAIAEFYGVSEKNVSAIKRGIIWGHVE
jgi:transcriptional regulator